MPDGPARVLFNALHELHHQAGWPSLRDMAREIGCSHTTVSVAFSGPRVPRWGLLELIVETLHGDVDGFHRLWLATGTNKTGTNNQPTAQPDSASPLRAVPRQLPADVAGFTGRGDQLASLDRLIADSVSRTGPVVISAVSGTAGVGKTALAVHWAHRIAEHFPDGQLYVNLRGYDPDRPMAPTEALEGFLRALSSDAAVIPHDPVERAARYRTLLTDRKMLVLLDNAHSVAQVRDLLPGAGGCLVLVTSRDTLPALVARHGAVRVNLDLLTLDEAVDLLRALLGARVDTEPAQAAALATQCALLPLALRIAAELATSRPRDTLAELVAELGDESRRLDLLAAGDDEYTAVRAVFSWSRRNLSVEVDRAFLLFGLHPCRQLDSHGVAALLGTDRVAAYRLLDTLCRGHLVEETATGQFAMHDLLRAYAAEQAVTVPHAERMAALTRLADYYLHAAECAVATVFPPERAGDPALGAPPMASPEQARAWLDRERANLLAIAQTDLRHTGPLSRTLAEYLDVGAHYGDALIMHGLALAAARSTGDRPAEAAALNLLGVACRRLGDYTAAIDHHRVALDLHREFGDQAGQATALHGLGTLYWRTGRYLDARDHLHQALMLWTAVDDRVAQGTILYGLGTVYLQLGDYREAVAHHLRALDLHRETGNRLGESRTLNNLGAAYERLGRLTEAQEHYQRSLTLNREIGNRVGVAVALTNLGSTCTRLGRFDEAQEHHVAALPMYRETGYRVGEADAMCSLGVLYLRWGRHEEALVHLREAVAVAREIGEIDVETSALVGLGDTLRVIGRQDQARSSYEAALARVAETGDRYEHARALVGLAHLHRDADDLAQAGDSWQQALALYTDLELPEADEVRAHLVSLDDPGLEKEKVLAMRPPAPPPPAADER